VANCPIGTFVTGGGFTGASDLNVYGTRINSNGWAAYAYNPTGSNRSLTAYAVCIKFP